MSKLSVVKKKREDKYKRVSLSWGQTSKTTPWKMTKENFRRRDQRSEEAAEETLSNKCQEAAKTK